MTLRGNAGLLLREARLEHGSDFLNRAMYKGEYRIIAFVGLKILTVSICTLVSERAGCESSRYHLRA